LKKVLRQTHLSVIAETKRRSPSSGVIKQEIDPIDQASAYLNGGAAALSVLTDGPSFGGSLEDLTSVSQVYRSVPILRKDFIIDPAQMLETVKHGATAVLLIAAVLQHRLKYFVEMAALLGLDALVEVAHAKELPIALSAGAEIIAVNNRDLHTFKVDLNLAEALSRDIPKKIIKVAASGIHGPAEAERMRSAGYDAILVGEALMRSSDPIALIRSLMVG
jgi:indole-3-glycerol phosphate synthase